MADDPIDEIPGVSDAEVVDAIGELLTIPTTSLDDSERFLVAVRSLAESRAQRGWQNEGSNEVGVFILAPYPRPVGQKFGALPTNNLAATNDPVLGRMFFLNRDASSGRAMELPTSSNSVLEWLIEKGLGKLPIVMIHRNSHLMISRVSGADGDIRTDVIRDTPTEATAESLYQGLKLAHKEIFLTPTVCPEIWENERAEEYIPARLAEKTIQKKLFVFLVSWFRGVVKVNLEQPIKIGRIDISLMRRQEEGLFCWAALELKIVKSFHNAKKPKAPKPVSVGDNVEAVAEGVRQARAFGIERTAEPFLEVYDLRKDKSEDLLKRQEVLNELEKWPSKPTCRIWPVYGSSSDARYAPELI